MTIIELAQRVQEMGGELFLVGGAVRDMFLGVESHDHDYVVCGVSEEAFVSSFGNPKKTGNLFPVFRFVLDDGEDIEVALARKEMKVSEGHNGFQMVFDETIAIKEDLVRRDTTMNSIALSVLTNELVDPFNGVEDIKAKVVRATSIHFIEDPLRVLRVARQASKFGFDVTADTLDLMHQCKSELHTLPFARIWGEMEKALQTKRPSVFFKVLRDADVLGEVFPEIANLIGQTQPEEYHPEGDAFNHTMMVLDEVAEMTDSVEIRFSALFHDVGKGLTPKESLPKHHNHDVIGARLIESWNSERFPAKVRKIAMAIAKNHMRIGSVEKAGKILDVLQELKKSSAIEAMRCVVQADMHKTLAILEEDFVDQVLGKVEIPEQALASKDGQRIAMAVRQARIAKINELL